MGGLDAACSWLSIPGGTSEHDRILGNSLSAWPLQYYFLCFIGGMEGCSSAESIVAGVARRSMFVCFLFFLVEEDFTEAVSLAVTSLRVL
jgi:hypothetical protein